MTTGEEQEGSSRRKGSPETRGDSEPQSLQTNADSNREGGDIETREDKAHGGRGEAKTPPADVMRGD